MKFGAIIAGLVFLFNPNINLIDLLPDAIGFGLLLYGIMPFSHIQGRVSEAANAFRMLCIIELCKLGSLYFYSFFTGEDQLMILLITMVFAAFEIFFGFQAFNHLFSGIEDFASAEEGSVLIEKLKTIRIFSLVFVIAKATLAFLPDLTLLDDARYGEVTGTGIRSWQDYRVAFMVFAFVLILVAGIVWLSLTISFFRRLKKEKDLVAEINRRATEYYNKTESLIYRHSILALGFLMYAFFFCLELKIEGYSVLPPMISAVLFFIFFLLIKRFYKKDAIIGMVTSLAYLVTSAIAYIQLYCFADEYYLEDAGFGFSETIIDDIDGTFAVFDEYFAINVMVALSQLVFLAMMILLFVILRKMVRDYCGMPKSMIDEKDKTDAMRHHEEFADKEAKAAIRKPIVWFFVAAILTVASCSVFPLLQVYFPSFFTIDLIIRILFVTLAVGCVSKLRQGVKVRGGLDLE